MPNTLPAPIYQSERATIYCGDCLDILPHLTDVDLIFCDPPYCSGGQFRGDRMRPVADKYQVSGTVKKYRGFSGDNRDQRQFLAWMTTVLRSVNVKTGGLVASYIDWRNLPSMWDAFGAADLVTLGIAVWDKTEASRPTLGRPRQQAEFIVWGTRGKRAVKGPVVPGVWRKHLAGSQRVHISQKPEIIARDFCLLTPLDGVVCDAFMGSGSTGIGCIQAGRKFIGIEIDPEHCAVAVDRIRKEEEANA